MLLLMLTDLEVADEGKHRSDWKFSGDQNPEGGVGANTTEG
jgi:hypothetical protein